MFNVAVFTPGDVGENVTLMFMFIPAGTVH
jgi:hypothetical protein